MLIVVHYCYRFLCTVVTDSCALLLPFFVHSPYHFLCTRDFCLHRLDPVIAVSVGQSDDTLTGPVGLLYKDCRCQD